MRVTKKVFLNPFFSLGMAAAFLRSLDSASSASGFSLIVPISAISPSLFRPGLLRRGVAVLNQLFL